MKKINITIITIIASLITSAFLILMNDIVISIRLNELRSNLQDIDRREGNIDNIGLVANYEIHKKLFENRITQEEADDIEHRINSLVILEKEKPSRTNVLYPMMAYPALMVINFNRMIIGKLPLSYDRSDVSGHVNIDLAYYFERNLDFQRAKKLYTKSLANDNLNNSMKAGVLLHIGYCYALLGYNDKARTSYLTVINSYGQESSAITATILLGYLEGFRLARERVINTNDDPLLTSQNLVNLLAYKQALLILETAEHRARPEDLPRLNYFKARCFSGMGETNKAVVNYMKVITSSPSSRYARYANRKLYIAGSSGGDGTIKKISIELNKTLQDPVLSKMIENGERIKTVDIIKENKIKIDIPPDLKAQVATIIANNKFPLPASTEYPIFQKNNNLIIFTNDGNTFGGKYIDQTIDDITMITSSGRIDIKKKRIARIQLIINQDGMDQLKK